MYLCLRKIDNISQFYYCCLWWYCNNTHTHTNTHAYRSIYFIYIMLVHASSLYARRGNSHVAVLVQIVDSYNFHVLYQIQIVHVIPIMILFECRIWYLTWYITCFTGNYVTKVLNIRLQGKLQKAKKHQQRGQHPRYNFAVPERWHEENGFKIATERSNSWKYHWQHGH